MMKSLITLLITVVVISLSSCCKSNLIETYNFSDSDGLVVPYTGNETLEFIDDSNNIISYNNGYRKIKQEEIEECDGGCCDYYLVERYDHTYFESTTLKSNLQITITNDFDLLSGKPIVPPFLSFVWDYYETEPNVTSTWFNSLPVVSMKQAAIDRGMFVDSLVLRDVKYYDIYTFTGDCIYQDRFHADSLFYSESEGVVGIRFSDGSLWTKK